MPITPKVGQSYETAGGHKATILFKADRPDKEGCEYGGSVKLNGHDEYSWWTPEGTDPRNTQYTLAKPWPADDARQYQPITQTADGVYRAMATFYSDLPALTHDWTRRGCAYALQLDKDESGEPTAAVVKLS